MGLLVEKHQGHRGNKVGPWQLLFCYFAGSVQSFPAGAVVRHLPAKQEMWVRSLGGEDPLEKEATATPVFCPGESHGQRSLVGCSPWGREESDTAERLSNSRFSAAETWQEGAQGSALCS